MNFSLSKGQPSESFSLPPANLTCVGQVGYCLFLKLPCLFSSQFTCMILLIERKIVRISAGFFIKYQLVMLKVEGKAKIRNRYKPLTLCLLGNLVFFLSSADIFQNRLSRKILSGISLQCLKVWIQIENDRNNLTSHISHFSSGQTILWGD